MSIMLAPSLYADLLSVVTEDRRAFVGGRS